VVSMVSRVIDHASSGSSGRSPRTLKARAQYLHVIFHRIALMKLMLIINRRLLCCLLLRYHLMI